MDCLNFHTLFCSANWKRQFKIWCKCCKTKLKSANDFLDSWPLWWGCVGRGQVNKISFLTNFWLLCYHRNTGKNLQVTRWLHCQLAHLPGKYFPSQEYVTLQPLSCFLHYTVYVQHFMKPSTCYSIYWASFLQTKVLSTLECDSKWQFCFWSMGSLGQFYAVKVVNLYSQRCLPCYLPLAFGNVSATLHLAIFFGRLLVRAPLHKCLVTYMKIMKLYILHSFV